MKILSLCLLAVALPLAYGSLTLSECTSATNGQKWWSGLIQKQCKWTPSKSEIILIACRTPKAHKVIQPGGDARDADFHYECEGDDDALEISVEHCYMPNNGPALLVGESAELNGGIYTCEEVEQNGQIVVTRSWSKVTEGCDYKGKRYNLYAYFFDKKTHTRLRCYKRGGVVAVEAVGCLMPDGKTYVNFWASKDGKFCEPKKGDPHGSNLLENSVSCKAKNGDIKKIWSTWIEEGIVVRCELKNLNNYKSGKDSVLLTKIVFWQCYRKISYKSFKVRPNQAAKAPDGHFYACNIGTGKNHLGTALYKLVKLTNSGGTNSASSYQCEIKGKKVDINQYLIINNVRYRCYYNKKSSYYISNCQADDLKYTSKNKVRDYKTYGMICEQKSGIVVWRKLTDKEYTTWKQSNGGSISSTGGAGEGAEGAVKKCDPGYEIVEVSGRRKCKDINECIKGGHDCNNYERCHNTEGSWACLCKSGTVRDIYTGRCGDIICPCPKPWKPKPWKPKPYYKNKN